jgi:hypothetical protein
VLPKTLNLIPMYFCYVDESGDVGAYDATKPDRSGSPYFILSGLIVNAEKWKFSLDVLKSFRKDLAAQAYLPYDIEFHCAEMIDARKTRAFQQISISDRWSLIEEYARVIGQNPAFSIISIVLNKLISDVRPEFYLTACIDQLYKAFDEFLKSQKDIGLIFFDRANERYINTHVRKLLGTGSSGQIFPEINISRIIEDPIFRVSSDSMFIQAADVISYTLREQEFSNGARRKHHANEIFRKKLEMKNIISSFSDEKGVIRI